MLDFIIGNDDFGKRLAEKLNCKYREFREEYYPDGEPCPRVLAEYDEIEGRNVAVITRIRFPSTPEKINIYLHNLFRMTSNLADEELYNANSVEVILPYFILGRQDHNPRKDPSEIVRIRDKGKDIGYKSLIKILRGLSVNRIVTFNPHFHVLEDCLNVEEVNVVALSGTERIGEHFQSRLNDETIITGRDEKAGKMAEELANSLGLEYYSLRKERISERDVMYEEKFNAQERDILVIDDLTTGGILKFINRIENPGKIYFSVVHATLTLERYNVIMKLLKEKSVQEFVATNTTITPFSKIDVLPKIAKFYMKA